MPASPEMPLTEEEAATRAIAQLQALSDEQTHAQAQITRILHEQAASPFVDVHELLAFFDTLYFGAVLGLRVSLSWSSRLTLYVLFLLALRLCSCVPGGPCCPSAHFTFIACPARAPVSLSGQTLEMVNLNHPGQLHKFHQTLRRSEADYGVSIAVLASASSSKTQGGNTVAFA